MPKESLRDKLDGNQLDLSMSSLEVIPVKDIASIPKGTQLDLSCNLIREIPIEFCSLTYLVKLDLSKNHLTSLPVNFGNLNRLQHLDLFSNSIQTLPDSFCHLKSLKWLDLKDNALEEPLRSVAGDCLDEGQCRTSAKEVVAYMKIVLADHDRRKQQMLQKQRDAEIRQKAEEEQERLRKKQEKLKEKEQRRREYDAKNNMSRKQPDIDAQERQSSPDLSHSNGIKTDMSNQIERGGLSCCGVLLAMLIGLFAIVIGLFIYCQNQPKDQFCRDSKKHLLNYYNIVEKQSLHYYKIVHKMVTDFMK